MKKSDFKLIMDAINTRIESCSKYLGNVTTTEHIKQLTIQQAFDLKKFCADEEPIMTKIAMVDLYHIIGMGNLTPIQMSIFMYKMKEYLQYRPRVKCIAHNLDSIFSLPKLPVATQYKLLGLCDLTLSTDFDGEVDDACIEDYVVAKSSAAVNAEQPFTDDLPYRLNGKTITLDLSRSAKFVAILTRIYKCPVNEANLLNKIELKKSYSGIDWIASDSGIATGVVTAENNLKKIEAYYRHAINLQTKG